MTNKILDARSLEQRIKATERTTSEGRALVVLCLATVAVFSNMYATQPILPVIGQEFGLLPSEAGLTISTMVLAIATSAVFYGLLSDRIGRRPVIIGSTLALTIPTLLCAVAPNFVLLIICRIGQGLLIPGFVAITITYIHEEFTAWRGVAVGWYTAASIMGGFTGRLQGGLMTEFVNWRFAFVTFGIINLLSGYALWRYLPTSRNFARRKTRAGFNLSELLACLKNRRLLGAYLLGPAIFLPFIGLFTYLPYYLTRPPFNLSTVVVSFIFVVYLAGVVAAPISGRFSGRLGRRRVMAIGVIMMAGGSGLTLTPWLITVFVGLVIMCFGMFTTQSTVNAFIGDSVKVEAGQGRGSAVSLYQMSFYVGGSIGGFVPGLLWQSGGWLPVVVGCLASLMVGLVAIRWLCR